MLEDLTPPRVHFSCKVRSILEDLSKSDRVILEDALATDINVWSHAALHKALNGRGIHVAAETIRVHRLGLCSCARES